MINNSLRKTCSLMFIILLGVVCVYRSPNVGTDYDMYYLFFRTTLNGSIEHGYKILNSVAQYFNNFQLISLFMYIVIILGVFLLGLQLSLNICSIVSFFVITCFYIGSFNIMREYIALGFVCLGLFFLLKFYKHTFMKYILFFVFIYIASLFHRTAIFGTILIILPKISYGKKTVLISGVVTSILAFTNIISVDLSNELIKIIPFYKNKYVNSSYLLTSGHIWFMKYLPIIFLFSYLYMFVSIHPVDTVKLKFILSGFLLYLIMFSADGSAAIGRLQTYTTMFPIFFACLFLDDHNYKPILKNNVIYQYSNLIKVTFVLLYIIFYIIEFIRGDQGVIPYSFM